MANVGGGIVSLKKALRRPGEDLSQSATLAYSDERDRVAPYYSIEDGEGELPPEPALLPVGWDAAKEYHRLKKVLGEGTQRIAAKDAAVKAIIERARQVLRHQYRPHQTLILPWSEAPGAELDLDETLENRSPYGVEAQDIRVQERRPWRADLVLILDISLSMSGEKLALMAVAATVMALTMPMEDLAVVVFDTTAQSLKPLGASLSTKEFVRRLLEVPAQGYTCLEDGLKEGLKAIRLARKSQRGAILMTDGVYNVGWDPKPLAARFPQLNVIKLGTGTNDKGLCQELSELGRGRMMVAETYEDLPEVSHRLVRELARRG